MTTLKKPRTAKRLAKIESLEDRKLFAADFGFAMEPVAIDAAEIQAMQHNHIPEGAINYKGISTWDPNKWDCKKAGDGKVCTPKKSTAKAQIETPQNNSQDQVIADWADVDFLYAVQRNWKVLQF